MCSLILDNGIALLGDQMNNTSCLAILRWIFATGLKKVCAASGHSASVDYMYHGCSFVDERHASEQGADCVLFQIADTR